MEIYKLLPMDKFDDYMKKCDLLITHAGVGSILDGIRKGKKMLVVPRLKEYKEHTNDHQLQILKEFADLGYIYPVYKMKDLSDAIKNIDNFNPKKFEGSGKMISIITDYIDKNVKDVKK